MKSVILLLATISFSLVSLSGVAAQRRTKPSAPTAPSQASSTYSKEKDSDLWNAARRGDLAALNSLLATRANPNAQNAIGLTALMMAASLGHSNVAQALLTKGANANAKDEQGRTALMLALFYDHNEVGQELIRKGADVNAASNTGETPLTLAAYRANETAVATLLGKGANVNAKVEDGLSPLMWAVHFANIKIVDALLTKGADVTVRWQRLTLGNFAYMRGDEAIKKALRDKSISVESPDSQLDALMYIGVGGPAFDEKFSIDKLIDETGAQDVSAGIVDANVKAEGGWTPLMRAAHKGQLATLKALLAKQADFNARGPLNVTALLLALLNGHGDAAKLLIEGGADVNAKSDDGTTPLIASAEGNFTTLVLLEMLLAKGADVRARNSKGQTALEILKTNWPRANSYIELLENAERKQKANNKN